MELNEEISLMGKRRSGVFVPGVASTKQLWDMPNQVTPISLPALLRGVIWGGWHSMISSRGMGESPCLRDGGEHDGRPFTQRTGFLLGTVGKG